MNIKLNLRYLTPLVFSLVACSADGDGSPSPAGDPVATDVFNTTTPVDESKNDDGAETQPASPVSAPDSTQVQIDEAPEGGASDLQDGSGV